MRRRLTNWTRPLIGTYLCIDLMRTSSSCGSTTLVQGVQVVHYSGCWIRCYWTVMQVGLLKEENKDYFPHLVPMATCVRLLFHDLLCFVPSSMSGRLAPRSFLSGDMFSCFDIRKTTLHCPHTHGQGSFSFFCTNLHWPPLDQTHYGHSALIGIVSLYYEVRSFGHLFVSLHGAPTIYQSKWCHSAVLACPTMVLRLGGAVATVITLSIFTRYLWVHSK
jgi:hypothetical protein